MIGEQNGYSGRSPGQVKQPTVAKRPGWPNARPSESVRLERKSTVFYYYPGYGGVCLVTVSLESCQLLKKL